jgi:hypothetical protein
MKKVMLIGDSIRLGYQARVTELLGEAAAVSGPADNCRFSSFTLFQLASWVPDGDYDVIQWNNGQWDVCYMMDGKIHTPLDQYLQLQSRIAIVLRKKTKRLIFATTTPVWPEQFATAKNNPRKNEDIDAYNRAAVDLLGRTGVEINDLNTPIAADVKRYIREDMVHLTSEGNEVCAKRIAAMIQG